MESPDQFSAQTSTQGACAPSLSAATAHESGSRASSSPRPRPSPTPCSSRPSVRASSASPGRGATAPSSARATAPEGLRRAPLCRPAPWSSNPSRTSTPPGSGPAERPASTGGPIAPPQSDRPHLSGRFWRHAFLPRPSKSTAKARMKIAAASKTMLSGSMSLPCNTISRASAVMAMKIG